MTSAPKAVCLLSGGMDSAVTLAEARAKGREVHALSFQYGQRHQVELKAAARVASAGGAADWRTVSLDLAALGGSSLTDDLPVPKDRAPEDIGEGVPSTYVPARNTVFLSVALGWAEILGAQEIFLGVNAVDYSGYPDCRPEFLRAFEEMAQVATAAGTEKGTRIHIRAPLLNMDKAAIVRRAEELDVDLGLTHTCYDPVMEGEATLACGRCDACSLRLKGFAEAGCTDPLSYAPLP